MKIITQNIWSVENYHYLCSVLRLLTPPQRYEKGT
nr:MAG TPA: hypothetical protein [Caudoviricetes sp.]